VGLDVDYLLGECFLGLVEVRFPYRECKRSDLCLVLKKLRSSRRLLSAAVVVCFFAGNYYYWQLFLENSLANTSIIIMY
jgi:hypothetical protein